MQRRPAKLTPFRDRAQHQQADTPSSLLQREFRFSNENEDSSNVNPIMYQKSHLREIRRKGKGHNSNGGSNCGGEDFQCNEDYEDEVKNSHYLNQNQNQNQKSSRCHSQDNVVKLTQSQEIFFKRPHGMASLANLPVNSSLTFGSMKQNLLKNSLSSNQQFMEEKKMKNQILDQIIKKSSKMSVVKSQEFLRRSQRPEGPAQILSCANQDGKKAKYRVVGDQEEEQLYYCSKCSIMLLQQGFKVEEITRKSEYSRRRKDCEAVFSKITDLQGRLKYHMNSLDSDNGSNLFTQAKSRLEETYDIITFIVEQMKARDFEAMQHAQQKLESQRKRQKAKLFDKFSKLDNIRDEMERLISSSELTESQLVAAIETYSSTISNYERYDPIKFQIEEEPIEQKLERLINEVSEHYTARKSQFSFQTDSDAPPDATPEVTHKPFRNLFPEENSQRKCNSRYYNGEFIEEEDDHYSPSFKREN